MSAHQDIPADRKVECTNIFKSLMKVLEDDYLPAHTKLREVFNGTAKCDDVHNFQAQRDNFAKGVNYFDKSALDRILSGENVSARDELIAQQQTKEGRNYEMFYDLDRVVKKLNPKKIKSNYA